MMGRRGTAARPAVLGVLIVIVAAAVVASPARADEATIVRFLDEQGRKAYAAHRYRDALDYLLLVNSVVPSPAVWYNVGVTAHLAEERELAFVYLTSFLESADADSSRRADAEVRAGALRKELCLARVESEPRGATIRVDEREHGEYGRTPHTIPLRAGTRSVVVSHVGYESQTVVVEAVPGREVNVNVSLVPKTSVLHVSTSPPRAPFSVYRAAGGPVVTMGVGGKALTLPVGTYRVRMTLPSYLPTEATVALREGSPIDVALAPALLPRPVGRVLISTSAKGATVLLDGRVVAVAPATLVAVEEGSHMVEVRANGYARWSRRIRVRQQKPVLIDAKLVPDR